MRNRILRIVHREHGQTLVMFVLMIAVLIGFVGLGVDLGFAYISRAKLSKAVDAACLNGMRNYYQGTAQASLVASNTFLLNYGSCGRDVAPPSLNINFTKDANNDTILNVTATVAINTFFIRVLPAIGGYSWKTLTVGDTAQATRTKVYLALALDRSGSMDPSRGPSPMGDGSGSGGGYYLPGAVATFINFFSDSIDEASMASFASTASQDISMEQPFKSDITKAAYALTNHWCGGTFSQGGLTNALVQENNITIPSSQVALQVVVFFTDGLANMIQDTLSCPGSITWNFGGQDSGTSVGFWNVATTTTSCSDQNNACGDGSSLRGCSPACSATQFYSNQNGTMESFTRANVTAEAKYRCIQVAQQMQSENILVYAIGLGGSSGVNMDFLSQVANATNSPTYNASAPTGLALLADDPSQLQAYFTAVANDILYRLTQ
ncbi:MAG TPA: VWA domain-containing protein [Verrucomicrobiae bacterium]|nr:VWA domain-containing protein [Verrucomicrobiae bacterium]